MPRYIVKQPSFIGTVLWPEGSVVEYGGEPGANLELLPDQSTPATLPIEAGTLVLTDPGQQVL